MFDLDFSNINWSVYSPGLLEQDIFTLPIELGLGAAVTHFTPIRSQPLWPFDGEVTTRNRQPTRHPGRTVGLVGVGLGAATFAYLGTTQGAFPIGAHFRGLLHSHAMTELITTTAKMGFRRKRPFYDSESKKTNGTAASSHLREDDSKSFFSGHSSHAFALTHYLAKSIRVYSSSPVGGWIVSSLLYAGAADVAATRAIDGQHNWSDVIVGGIVGMGVSELMFNRVEDVVKENVERTAENSRKPKLNIAFYPEYSGNKKNPFSYFLSANLDF